jgi:hypothetical protein
MGVVSGDSADFLSTYKKYSEHVVLERSVMHQICDTGECDISLVP